MLKKLSKQAPKGLAEMYWLQFEVVFWRATDQVELQCTAASEDTSFPKLKSATLDLVALWRVGESQASENAIREFLAARRKLKQPLFSLAQILAKDFEEKKVNNAIQEFLASKAEVERFYRFPSDC